MFDDDYALMNLIHLMKMVKTGLKIEEKVEALVILKKN